MRGQTVYDRRGMPLALPNGTLENPALRFARERMGLYRQGAGHLGIGINRFRAIDVAETDTFIRSNSPGTDTVVAPLAITRANATTAPLQETALDVYEIGAPVARMAAYRETPTRWGWKLYSFNGPVTPVLLLGVAGTGLVTVPGGLTVGGPVTLQGSLSLAGGAALDPPIGIGGVGTATRLLSLYPTVGFPTGILQGSAATNHAVVLQNTAPTVAPTARGIVEFGTSPLGGGANALTLYTDGAAVGDLILGRATERRMAFTATATTLSGGGLERMRIATANGNVGIRTATPEKTLHIIPTGASIDGIYLGGIGAYEQGNSVGWTAATQRMILSMVVTGGPGHLTNVGGDGCLFTTGNTPGRLALGSNNTLKLLLDAASAGTVFSQGAVEHLRITNAGSVGVNIAAPTTRVQVQTSAYGEGLTVVAPGYTSQMAPMIGLWESPTSPTRQAVMALALIPSHYGAGGAGDFHLYTAGANAGRTLLGTASIPRLIVSVNGNVTIGTPEGSAKFNVMQSSNGIGGGIRMWHTDATHYADLYCDPGYRTVIGGNGYSHLFFAVASGFATFGSAATDLARIHCLQQSGAPNQGIYVSWGNGASNWWVADNGWTYWNAVGNAGVALWHGGSWFTPPTDQATNLGHPSVRWANFYAVHGTFDGNVTIAGTVSANVVSGTTVSAANLGATNANVTGGLTVGAALNAGSVSTPSLTATNITSAGTIAGNVVNGTSGTIGGLAISTRNILNAGVIIPTEAIGGSIGDSGHWFGGVFCNAGYKPGGGDWQVLSDRRTKVASAEQPYERGLADLLRLQPVRYRYNGTYGTPKDAEYAGFRAEDLQAVAPEMVRTLRVARREGDEEEELLTVDTSDLKLMLLNAIRELAERLTAVEGKVA